MRALMVILFSIFSTAPILALEGDERPYIAVVGVGEASIKPDQLRLTFQIVSERKTSPEATAAVNDKTRAVLAIVDKAQEIVSTTTTGLTITPKFEYNREEERQQLVGFQVNQSITVLVGDIAAGADLFEEISSSIEALRGSISFETSTENALIEKARLLAIEDARRRANTYAEAAGQRLGRALIIEESGTSSQRLRFELQDKMARRYVQSEAKGGDLKAAAIPEVAYTAARTKSGPVLEPDAMRISVSIFAKFRLLKAADSVKKKKR